LENTQTKELPEFLHKEQKPRLKDISSTDEVSWSIKNQIGRDQVSSVGSNSTRIIRETEY
jgi:hypothetical protein